MGLFETGSRRVGVADLTGAMIAQLSTEEK